MKEVRLFDALTKADDELIDRAYNSYSEGKADGKKKKHIFRLIPAAACLAAAVIAGSVAFAVISEAKSYNEAIAFFEENGLSTEGLERSEIKEVYKDISSNSFLNSKTVQALANTAPEQYAELPETTPEALAGLWNSIRSEKLAPVEETGTVPDELSDVIRKNLFCSAKAFSDRLLKAETVAENKELRTVEYKITMLGLYGDVLAEYTVTCGDAYHVNALTATSDGGFVFTLGFTDYQYDYKSSSDFKMASDNGFASRVIKCDKNGKTQFDTALDQIEGDAVRYCFEKDGGYYVFGTHRDPAKSADYGETDVFAAIIDGDGKEIKRRLIAGSDFDSLRNAKANNGGFLLSVFTQSVDGDFEGSGYAQILPIMMTLTLDADLNITRKEKADGLAVTDARIGERNGGPVYSSDGMFDGFDAGTPTAYIDYGDFYLIVSENKTAVDPNTPKTISSIHYYTETVYSAYKKTGELIFRASADNSNIKKLKSRCPEYFGLDDSNGLDVVVWQMAPELYYFALYSHPSDGAYRWGIDKKYMNAEEVKTALSTYSAGEDKIYIIPWQNPLSSYIAECFINFGGEDMNAKMEAYKDKIRKMLFE